MVKVFQKYASAATAELYYPSPINLRHSSRVRPGNLNRFLIRFFIADTGANKTAGEPRGEQITGAANGSTLTTRRAQTEAPKEEKSITPSLHKEAVKSDKRKENTQQSNQRSLPRKSASSSARPNVKGNDGTAANVGSEVNTVTVKVL